MMACDGTDWVPWAGWTVTGYPAPQYSSSSGGLWTDNTTSISYDSAWFLNTGETLTSAGLGGLTGPVFFWYPDKGALRAGSTMGGWGESQFGTGSTVLGGASTGGGSNSVTLGWNSHCSAYAGVCIGEETETAGGANYAVAIGESARASGNGSVTLGRKVETGNGTGGSGFGDGSMAIGLIDPAISITTRSQVRGDNALGIFMGDQDGLVFASNNTMGLFGGRMVIDPSVPATQLNASTGEQLLELDVEGDIGAINYCDQDGNNCFTALQAGSGAIDDLSDANVNYTSSNMFLGTGVGATITTGTENTALGVSAMQTIDGGARNTAIGHSAMANATSGGHNTAVGKEALTALTTGNQNVAIGAWAGRSISEGYNNIAIGEQTLTLLTDGSGNVALGRFALSQTTGSDNTAVGAAAGRDHTSGEYNIIIGSDVQVFNSSGSYQLNIGNTIYGDMTGAATDDTGTAKIGINDTTPDVALDVIGDINFTGQIVDVSDIRMKYDIAPLQSPLHKLTSLNGISFKMKGDPEKTTEYGVSAQDVQKVFPELVSVVDPEEGTLGVNYNGLIAPMIEAMKEQQAQIEALQDEIRALKAERKDNQILNKPGEL